MARVTGSKVLSPGWAAERVSRLEALPLPKASTSMVVTARSAGLLRYLLACPGTEMSAYAVGREGYFVLSRVRGQARIADLWAEGGEETWMAAYSLAARAAAEDPGTVEVKAIAATAVERCALERNGFVARGAEPVFLYDPKGMLGGELRVQLLDGDEFYLDNPEYPYLT
jgi:hypothetical protein